ncbi:unnamed protein product [Sphagnum troendelagicum]|uniref:Uncharacterized protein n=1 Tax=Sphagnum troendelagicum TaxID=128251 RepID=A0ABP0US74_9BRYO
MINHHRYPKSVRFLSIIETTRVTQILDQLCSPTPDPEERKNTFCTRRVMVRMVPQQTSRLRGCVGLLAGCLLESPVRCGQDFGKGKQNAEKTPEIFESSKTNATAAVFM